MANTNHASDKKSTKHVKTGGTEGGACLNRHISGVTTSSCSHRYQGLERARNEDVSWYMMPAYGSLVTAGVAKAGAWDPSVPGNFKTNSRTPYHHQSHHIIPNAVLNNCIAETGKTDPTLDLTRLLRWGLLDAKYNLNHKGNVIILPMTEQVAVALKLPKHLQPGARSHDGYSTLVSTKIKSVITDYAKVLKEGQEPDKHPPAPAALSKAKLERISRVLRIMIRHLGLVDPKKALEDHFPKP